MTKKLVSDRMVVSKADLEKKLTSYLRKAGRCIDAAAVVVARVATANPDQANWTVSAVKYGKAPKSECDDELTRIVPLFLRHFNVAPETPEDEETAASEGALAEEEATVN
ncbi:MAG TPA: hypothetical protein VIJ67_13835 [Pseudolabrys sp.]